MKDQMKKPGNIDAVNEKKNKDQQAVDKKPGEERGKGEMVTNKDLKGKQVDADPSKEEGKPLNQ
ncbi:hypothetical protein [Niastella sp. OAS944]|uniref:hypothetical protein n=1 Tax=Niastella sp. OAS944 TaxID=2664089 RepID=UPI003497F68E|nr:hypothetical protein [Chitinophagaceae bacterium OAS944]